MGVLPGDEIINAGGSMESRQVLHGSEFWTFLNGKFYHLRINPSDWKEDDDGDDVVVGLAYNGDDDGVTIVMEGFSPHTCFGSMGRAMGSS